MRATSFPFITHAKSREDKTAGGTGGIVDVFTSGSALNTGDCVYLSAANTVSKSLTAANYAGFIGVVVGGRSTNMNIIDNKTGVAATSASGQEVIVQLSGVATVVAGGTVTAGTHFSVMPDAAGTAGRVVAGTTAGQILGTALTTGSAAAEMKILIRHR